MHAELASQKNERYRGGRDRDDLHDDQRLGSRNEGDERNQEEERPRTVHLQVRAPLAVVPRRTVAQIHQGLQIRPKIGTVSQRVELIQIERDVDQHEDRDGIVDRPHLCERPFRVDAFDDRLQPFDELRRCKGLRVLAQMSRREA